MHWKWPTELSLPHIEGRKFHYRSNTFERIKFSRVGHQLFSWVNVTTLKTNVNVFASSIVRRNTSACLTNHEMQNNVGDYKIDQKAPIICLSMATWYIWNIWYVLVQYLHHFNSRNNRYLFSHYWNEMNIKWLAK